MGQLAFIEEFLDICRGGEAAAPREERIAAALRHYLRRLARQAPSRASRAAKLAELQVNLEELGPEITRDLAAAGVPAAQARQLIGQVQEQLRAEIVSAL